jgi:hypothetical protein
MVIAAKKISQNLLITNRILFGVKGLSLYFCTPF